MAEKMLSTKEVAEMKNVKPVTVRVWLSRGLIPGAQLVDTPRGAVWEIPESAALKFEPSKPTGRPKVRK